MKSRIIELIDALNVTSKAFAEAIGVSSGNVTDWKKGRVLPTVKVLSRIYENYDVNLHWLLTGEGPMLRSASGTNGADSIDEKLQLEPALAEELSELE